MSFISPQPDGPWEIDGLSGIKANLSDGGPRWWGNVGQVAYILGGGIGDWLSANRKAALEAAPSAEDAELADDTELPDFGGFPEIELPETPDIYISLPTPPSAPRGDGFQFNLDTFPYSLNYPAGRGLVGRRQSKSEGLGMGMMEHDLLSPWHIDTVTDVPIAGDIVYANSDPLWDRLGIGTEGQILGVAASGLPAWQDNLQVGADAGGSGTNIVILDIVGGAGIDTSVAEAPDGTATVTVAVTPLSFLCVNEDGHSYLDDLDGIDASGDPDTARYIYCGGWMYQDINGDYNPWFGLNPTKLLCVDDLPGAATDGTGYDTTGDVYATGHMYWDNVAERYNPFIILDADVLDDFNTDELVAVNENDDADYLEDQFYNLNLQASAEYASYQDLLVEFDVIDSGGDKLIRGFIDSSDGTDYDSSEWQALIHDGAANIKWQDASDLRDALGIGGAPVWAVIVKKHVKMTSGDEHFEVLAAEADTIDWRLRRIQTISDEYTVHADPEANWTTPVPLQNHGEESRIWQTGTNLNASPGDPLSPAVLVAYDGDLKAHIFVSDGNGAVGDADENAEAGDLCLYIVNSTAGDAEMSFIAFVYGWQDITWTFDDVGDNH